MNSNNAQSLKTCIKPIINGIFYERKMMSGGLTYKGGYNYNHPDPVVHMDNSSLLKSCIRTIVIENNYTSKR